MLMKLYSKKALRVFTAFLLVFSLVICFVPAQGSAEGDAEYEQKLSSLNDEKAAAREKRISAQSKVQQLKNQQTEMIEEKVALEERNAAALEEISIIREQIALIREEIKEADDRIAEKERDVSEALDQENAQLEKYRSRIRAMEENSGYNILGILSCE